jgi:hypothetical protein
MAMVTAEKPVKAEGPRKTANYLVTNYTDLRDVVLTIEKLIMDQTEIRNKNLLRQGCDISIVPLSEREGWVVRVKLHPDM